jgi:hypothetical protein
MAVRGAGERIRREVLSWPGVAAKPHQFGGTEYDVGARQLGHVHGDSTLDAPFPRAVRDALLREGRAQEHRFVPDSGWVTLDLETEADVDNAVALLRLNYERAKPRRSP